MKKIKNFYIIIIIIITLLPFLFFRVLLFYDNKIISSNKLHKSSYFHIRRNFPFSNSLNSNNKIEEYRNIDSELKLPNIKFSTPPTLPLTSTESSLLLSSSSFNSNQKIAIIVPYFGNSLPNWFLNFQLANNFNSNNLHFLIFSSSNRSPSFNSFHNVKIFPLHDNNFYHRLTLLIMYKEKYFNMYHKLINEINMKSIKNQGNYLTNSTLTLEMIESLFEDDINIEDINIENSKNENIKENDETYKRGKRNKNNTITELKLNPKNENFYYLNYYKYILNLKKIKEKNKNKMNDINYKNNKKKIVRRDYKKINMQLKLLLKAFPYYFVEFKSLFGYLYQDYLYGYTHYGYGDLDLLVGK